ncbi:MAG: hypothetical protein F4137_14545 [Acidobacteria bacterium]|nr:hypothetical protein [Acidobacteriota bacterium]
MRIPRRAYRSAAVSVELASLVQESGKRGGVRVVFLSAGEDIPVFLLTVFAKNERANLTAKERTVSITAAKELTADYRRSP